MHICINTDIVTRIEDRIEFLGGVGTWEVKMKDWMTPKMACLKPYQMHQRVCQILYWSGTTWLLWTQDKSIGQIAKGRECYLRIRWSGLRTPESSPEPPPNYYVYN